MNSIKFEQVPFDKLAPIDNFEDHTVHQSKEWLQFIAESQSAEIITANILKEGNIVGQLSGLVFTKFGVRFFGSPFPGWTTSYMGFNLEPNVSRIEALKALDSFVFKKLNCIHYELMDRHILEGDLKKEAYAYRLLSGFEIDLSKSEEELFKNMKAACRRCIRKAEKSKVSIEVTTEADFVDDYFTQLEDVFAKQKLVPTYEKKRVELLCKNLLPSKQLLLLRAKNEDGTCIASGIFPAKNTTMFFWGGASLRKYQHLRPNEILQWNAMLYWKNKGILKYDMGGAGDYKRKYGGSPISIPWIRKSKYGGLETMRNLIKDIFSLKQRLIGRKKL